MNDVEKKKIELMRLQGFGYKKISNDLDISINTVKSYCRRRNLVALDLEQKDFSSMTYCKFCGEEIQQHEKRKKRVFCNQTCRTNYWTQNQSKINRKSVITQKCQVCGKDFCDYAKKERKYCSRGCYISSRFKGGVLCES